MESSSEKNPSLRQAEGLDFRGFLLAKIGYEYYQHPSFSFLTFLGFQRTTYHYLHHKDTFYVRFKCSQASNIARFEEELWSRGRTSLV